ncbi:MAG: hypothetical protein EXS33_01735 [Pedosphaera sp.]|nr:hypothetical protein [Pedosphaera sp.]
MKVLLHQFEPMTTGATEPQRRIIQLREALVAAGVDAEFFRWYDGAQTGDVLHFFGRVQTSLVRLAHQKGMRLVFTDSLERLRPCSSIQRRLRRAAVQVAQKILPYQIVSYLDWQSYQLADACVVGAQWEAEFVRDVFAAPSEKIHVVAPAGAADVAAKLKALYDSLPRTSR